MNHVPHIKIEQVKAIYPSDIEGEYEGWMSLLNGRIDRANEANAEQEQPLISAEEARKLGAGAEYFAPANPVCYWVNCEFLTKFPTTFEDGSLIKYRAIKQPEPAEPHAELKELFQKIDTELANYTKLEAFSSELVDLAKKALETLTNKEPTCQVRNEDTGVTETMTREKAKLLQAETKDVCDWMQPKQTLPWTGGVFRFDVDGIYTYKQKTKLKQVSWKDVPAHVAVTHKGFVGFYVGSFIYRDGESSREVLFLDSQGYGKDIHTFDDTEVLELAPASEQPWIAVQGDRSIIGLICEFDRAGLTCEFDQMHYRITGIAEGWVLK